MKINIDKEKIVGLRKIYADYKNIRMYNKGSDSPNYFSKEEMIEYKKDIVNKYIQEYTELAQNGITLDHLPEFIYTENQNKFINDIEESNLPVDIDYAYYTKYHEFCPAVTLDDVSYLSTKSSVLVEDIGDEMIIYAR